MSTETTQKSRKDEDVWIVDGVKRGTLIDLEGPMDGDRGRPHEMPREYSGWDVYNNETKKVDMELVSDWRDSLNSLLLFVSINLRWKWSSQSHIS